MASMNPVKVKTSVTRRLLQQKNLLRSYIDAGHDVQSAEDIYNAHGLKNSKVCVADIDTKKMIMKSRSARGGGGGGG